MPSIIEKLKNRKLIEKLPFLVLLILIAFLGFSHYVKGRENRPIFQETRRWQIASDAPGSGDVILFWDDSTSATSVSGWECISCIVTDAYYEKFPMGTSTYGGTGGTATHTHTISFVTSTAPSATLQYDVNTIERFPHATHYHTSISSPSMNATTSLPPYYQLKVIKKNNPTEIPQGVIAIFDTTSLPGNWELFTAADGLIIRGGPATSSVSSAHIHTGVSFTLDAASVCAQTVTKTSAGELCTHSHPVSGKTTDPAGSLPPFIDVVLARVTTATTSLPNGIIAIFDATPPTNWSTTAVSAINNDKFLRASSTGYGLTGGSSTHVHPNSTYTSGTTTNTTSTADVSPTDVGADVKHTHDVTVSFSSATNIPPYRGTVFAKYSLPNQTPQVTNVNLIPTADNSIILTENGTTTVTCVASTSDQNGWEDITTSTAVIYRSGASGTSTCTNENNCYSVSKCTLATGSGYDRDVTCTTTLWFIAEATDASSSYPTQTWQCEVKAIDSQNASSTNTDPIPPELNTLYAFMITPTINYGTLLPGASSTNAEITRATTTGNSGIDLNLYGVNMASSSYEIAVTNQEYSSSTFTHSDGTAKDLQLQASAENYNLDLSKPTSHPSTSTDDIYWKIFIPFGTYPTTYIGTTTISAIGEML